MKLFDRICMAAFSLLLSQFPLFVDQYEMRLQSHIAEARSIVIQFEEIAKKRKKSLNEYISKFITSEDLDIQSQGVFMENALQRSEKLSSFYARISTTHEWIRPFLFLIACDLSIAHETWAAFKVGLFFSESTVVWALFGFLIGYSIVALLRMRIMARRENRSLII